MVDDNRTNRRILEGILLPLGVKATSVEGAAEALKELVSAARSGDGYQVVLTDMNMPEMDGFGLVEEIRRNVSLSLLTVIMLTSGSSSKDGERYRALGIAYYLHKPVRRRELLAAILTALGQGETGPSAAMPAQRPEARTGLRILLAEDNRVNQTVATRMLQKLGHKVVVAENGIIALRLLAAQPFDLVLMDVQMPEMDGMMATGNIRDRERSTKQHIPIIAMTAHAMKGDRERCLAAGMDGYLTKPISSLTLQGAIASVETVTGPFEVVQ